MGTLRSRLSSSSSAAESPAAAVSSTAAAANGTGLGAGADNVGRRHSVSALEMARPDLYGSRAGVVTSISAGDNISETSFGAWGRRSISSVQRIITQNQHAGLFGC